MFDPPEGLWLTRPRVCGWGLGFERREKDEKKKEVTLEEESVERDINGVNTEVILRKRDLEKETACDFCLPITTDLPSDGGAWVTKALGSKKLSILSQFAGGERGREPLAGDEAPEEAGGHVTRSPLRNVSRKGPREERACEQVTPGGADPGAGLSPPQGFRDRGRRVLSVGPIHFFHCWLPPP